MGAKITIDSATLVNKGFEVIEAHWLFGIGGDRISVLVHPQSIVHSMVEFDDGAIKAQLGPPDMRMPISYALMFPRRASRPQERFSFLDHPMLTFAEPDRAKYPALDIAYDCMRRGGTAACVMNRRQRPGHAECRERGGRGGFPRRAVSFYRYHGVDRVCAGTRSLRRLAHSRRLCGVQRRVEGFGRRVSRLAAMIV